MKQIIITKPGALNEENKNMLLQENIILIELDKPEEIRVITPFEGYSGDDVVYSALETLHKDTFPEVHSCFMKRLMDKILNKKKSK